MNLSKRWKFLCGRNLIWNSIRIGIAELSRKYQYSQGRTDYIAEAIRERKEENKYLRCVDERQHYFEWCGINHSLVDYAADRNPDKHGARTPGTDSSIIREAESQAMRPDYYLVLPWHFKQEYLKREKKSLDRGVGMFFPLPTVDVVKRA